MICVDFRAGAARGVFAVAHGFGGGPMHCDVRPGLNHNERYHATDFSIASVPDIDPNGEMA